MNTRSFLVRAKISDDDDSKDVQLSLIVSQNDNNHLQLAESEIGGKRTRTFFRVKNFSSLSLSLSLFLDARSLA
jgi:hypothetical protein